MKLFLERLKLAFLVCSSPVILLILAILIPVLDYPTFSALVERIKHTLCEQIKKSGLPLDE